MAAKKTVYVRLSEEVDRLVEASAEASDRSKSAVIRIAVREYLQRIGALS